MTGSHLEPAARGRLMPAVSRFLDAETPTIVAGDGATVRDEAGNEYLDLFGMHAAMSHGYGHPAIVDAVTEQARELIFSAYDFPTNPNRTLAARLEAVTPGDLTECYFVNSGSEAVEVAITLARKATGNYEILSLGEAFHGRSYGARSLVGYRGYRSGFGPFLPGVVQVPSYNCEAFPGDPDPDDGAAYADLLEYVLEYQTGDVAAFIAEPMLGTAGNIPAPAGYFQRIKEICDAHDILFIADEVITGFGRTGEWFGIEHYGVEPDIMTTAKALGGGMPIGATIASPAVAAAFEPMDYFSTFGGHPVTTAAATAAIDVIDDEDLVAASRERGAHALDRLQSMAAEYDVIDGVRGRGLLLGVDLVDRDGEPLPEDLNTALRRAALDRGVIVPAGQGWRGNVVRLSPPLVISEAELDRGLDVFESCVADLEAQLASR